MTLYTHSVRTLFVTMSVVYPPLRGGPLRNWQNMTAMMEYGDVAFFSVLRFIPEDPLCSPGVKLAHYEYIEPLEESTIDLRVDSLLDLYYTPVAGAKLEQLMTEFQPDLVILEGLWLYRYFEVLKTYSCHIIFDTHNIELVNYRHQTELLLEQKVDLKCSIEPQAEYQRLHAIEHDLIQSSNQAWVCSQEDVRLLTQWYGKYSHIYVIPNTVNVESYCDPPTSPLVELEPKERNIIFSAAFGYLPNKEAANVLIEQIYPQLREIHADSRLLLVGHQSKNYQDQAFPYGDGIVMTGSVPDVRPYFASASILVVPLQRGGGTRLKILEAFASNCPVISTSKGAEGLNVVDGVHLLIRDTPSEIVEGICLLWSDPTLGQKLANEAHSLVQSEYSSQAVSSTIGDAIAHLL